MTEAEPPSRSGLILDIQRVSRLDGLPGDAELEAWAGAALAGEGPAEATLRIVDEEEGAALNQRYRGRQGPTNVLSFPFEAPPGVELPLLGDLVVCAPVVRREAREQGKPEAAHWAHMLVHGMLHLQGHDHQTEDEAARMEALERDILAGLGFPDPYQPSGDSAAAAEQKAP